MSKAKQANENAGVVTDEAPETTSTELSAPAAFAGGQSSVTLKDMDIPIINVVQKTSDIGADTGSIVVDKKYSLVEPEGEAPAIVLDAIKSWVEDVPYDDDYQGKTVHTEDDARRLSSQSQYEVIESACIILLLPQPEGNENDDAYPYPIGGTNYAMGRIYTRKGAYRSTFGRLATWKMFNPGKPWSAVLWKLKSQKEVKGKYTYFAPALAATATPVPAEAAAFLSTLGQAA